MDKISTTKSASEPGPDPTVFGTPKLTKAKTKHKISPLKLRKELVDKIANEEKNINKKIFKDYFLYQHPSFLVEDLYEVNQDENKITVNLVNDVLIDLKNDVSKKEVPETENPD